MSYTELSVLPGIMDKVRPGDCVNSPGCDRTGLEFDVNQTTWRAHPRYEYLEVSTGGQSGGRIRTIDRVLTNRNGVSRRYPSYELKQHLNEAGYWKTTTSVHGRMINITIHRALCETFHGLPSSPELEVRHLNGNKTDNRLENLKWGLHSENELDKVRHGTHNQVLKTHCPKRHEYTPENTYCKPGIGPNRKCRTCQRDVNRARKAALRAERRSAHAES
jgi:hypothetical protein